GVRELPVRAGQARVVEARAIVARVTGGKHDERIEIELAAILNAERRCGASTQEGDVVKSFELPGDRVTHTDLDRFRKESVRIDGGIGGGSTDDHRPPLRRRGGRGRG